MGNKNIEEQIEVEDIKIENVTEETYNDCSKEIGRRIGKATESEFKNVWKRKSISTKTK